VSVSSSAEVAALPPLWNSRHFKRALHVKLSLSQVPATLKNMNYRAKSSFIMLLHCGTFLVCKLGASHERKGLAVRDLYSKTKEQKMRKSIFSVILLAALVMLANSALAQNGRPLTLDEAVAMALRDNSTLRNAERRAQITGTNVVAARAGVLPNLNFSLSASRSQQADGDVERDAQVGFDALNKKISYQPRNAANSHSARLDLEQPLFDFGANWNSIRQADAAKSSSSKTYEFTKQNTILLVHQQYMGYLKELQLLKVYEDAVKSSEEQLKRTESMFKIGSVAHGDVFRARTTYGNDRIIIISQKNQVNNARGQLNVAL
jgi:outer membrane protein TolC